MTKSKEFYIPSLDGLRAVAVLIVFFSHVGLKGLMPGGFGVTIFFFLSGFLITTLLRMELERDGSVSLRAFYLRRVLRIFPPMYLTLLLAAFATVAIGEPLSPKTLGLQAVHLTNYHVAFHGTGEAIGTEVLWSLAVEEHFYLLFPLLFIALCRLITTPSQRASVLLALCLVVLGWRFVALQVLELPAEYVMHATDTRIDSILFGCILGLWNNPALTPARMRPATLWGMFALALVVLAATVLARDEVFRETTRYTLQGLALAPVFVAAIRFPNALPFRVLNFAAVRWIGLISYSLYLVHLPIIRIFEVTTTLRGTVLTIVSLAASIAAASMIYVLLEKPFARWRKQLSRASRGAS